MTSNLRQRVRLLGRNVLYRTRKLLMRFGVTDLKTLYPGSIIYGASSTEPEVQAPDGLPLPPYSLAFRVGMTDYDGFLKIGSAVKQHILQALPEEFSFESKRVYEFGCGSGRVLRHFLPEAETCEFWGSDLDYPSIEWLGKHLSPPFYFFQNTEQPVLPLESNSFDLVIVISVFTHVHENWSQWMMELRRILKPGGYIFCTFHGPNAAEESLRFPYRPGDYGMFVKNVGQSWNRFGPAVYHAPEWIAANWGSIFDIEFLGLGGLMNHQSIALMRKPTREGQPLVRQDVPILKMGVTHAVNVRAMGSIEHHVPAGRRLSDGFGIRGSGQVPLRGWVAFKDDQAVKMDVMIDEEVVATFSESDLRVDSGNFPLGGNTPAVRFEQTLDVSRWQAGVYELKVNFVSRRGDTYWLAIPLVIES